MIKKGREREKRYKGLDKHIDSYYIISIITSRLNLLAPPELRFGGFLLYITG